MASSLKRKVKIQDPGCAALERLNFYEFMFMAYTSSGMDLFFVSDYVLEVSSLGSTNLTSKFI